MIIPRGNLVALLAAAAQAPLGDRVRRVLDGGDYQRTLPVDPTPSDPPLDLHLPWLGKLLELLLYAGAAVVVALLLVWLVRLFRSRRTRDDEADVGAEAAPSLDVRLDAPDRLAAAGRFAEAIHALLLETLAALSRASRLPSSYTSREILDRARLPGRAREALSGLVLAVEVSHFGGAPATSREYELCLARFHDFLETYRGPAEAAPEAAA
jgi:hypothetical protein